MIEVPTLVGYFPKQCEVPAGWQYAAATSHVIEICSVSGCIAPSPDGWIDHWLHNDWGFFNTPSDAGHVVPSGSTGFVIFAYRLLPLQFEGGETKPIGLGDLAVEPLPVDFRSLGFDVVNKTFSAFFECSPLSCNYMANEIPVNRYCLVDDPDQAVKVAERFSVEQPEPGTYFVLEVLRAKQTQILSQPHI